ncbi:MAG: DNA/RNA non-specific endonuclease [Flavobacteriales bacterium]|jgi:endonuclease G, mitochondrial|nr:DNA/RNA non-specific endonuclease [Flavobacteriales bacterium]
MKRVGVWLLIFSLYGDSIYSQTIEELEYELDSLHIWETRVKKQIEEIRLTKVITDLKTLGLPSGAEVEIVEHKSMILGYDEQHEQARWVSHIIIPDVENGNVSRTNDFRIDPLVTTGTAVKADYWYSGYDRGHLAPSADFRWSQVALSESYFYSNMVPQLPELNRERWAQLENLLREYVIANKEQLYVVTGGVLNESLPKMNNEGHKNKVSIPKLFYKVVLDNSGEEKRGIAFLMPNSNCSNPILTYAVSIDSVEALTGLDFFTSLSEDEQVKYESITDVDPWRTKAMEGEVLPIDPTTLPKGKINTVQSQYYTGSKACVCGTVVATKYSEKSGATFLNLDKKFPNQIFSVAIWKDSRANFSYLPENELKGKKVCITGKLEANKGTPTMNISNEKSIVIVEE